MKGEQIYASHLVRLEKVYKDTTHPKDNLVLINRFIRKIKHAGLAPESIKKNISTLVIFSKWCTIPIQELTEDDIYDFLDYLTDYTYIRKGEECRYSPDSINSYKTVMKKFFKVVGRSDLIESLRGNLKVWKTIEKDQLLNKSDIETLLKYCENSRDRAIIASIYEAGPRKGELLSVQRKHLTFDANGVIMTFPEGKTGPRTVRLVFAASYLRTWIDDHPVKGPDGRMDLEAYLFVSLEPKLDKNEKPVYTQLTGMGLYTQIQKIAKRAGITKKVNPHSFRHARATDLAEYLTEQQMKKFLGWSQDSKMCARYVHDPDTEKAVLRQYGISIETTQVDGLKVCRCPRCKQINAEGSSFCSVCGFPLNQEAQDKVSQYEKQLSQILDIFGKLATGQVSIEDIKNQVKNNEK